MSIHLSVSFKVFVFFFDKKNDSRCLVDNEIYQTDSAVCGFKVREFAQTKVEKLETRLLHVGLVVLPRGGFFENLTTRGGRGRAYVT